MYVLIGIKKGTRFPSVITSKRTVVELNGSVTLENHSDKYDFLGIIHITDEYAGNVQKVIWHESINEGWLELTGQYAPS